MYADEQFFKSGIETKNNNKETKKVTVKNVISDFINQISKYDFEIDSVKIKECSFEYGTISCVTEYFFAKINDVIEYNGLEDDYEDCQDNPYLEINMQGVDYKDDIDYFIIKINWDQWEKYSYNFSINNNGNCIIHLYFESQTDIKEITFKFNVNNE